MAIHEQESPQEAIQPRITLLKEIADGQEAIYRFFIDGGDSRLTMTREDIPETKNDYTYHLVYENWHYGEADIHDGEAGVVIEWQGIADGQPNKLAEIEADRFMAGSSDYLLTAIKFDFPGTPVEDVHGNYL